MIDKFAQALTLMREAFEDAQTGAEAMASGDLAAEVDGAQQVINAASAVQVLRVAQYAGRDEGRDAAGAWVEVDHGVGHVSDFASDCFGPMLAMGSIAAERKVQTFAMLASKLPVTLAAMSAGDLDSWRATIIATELFEASPETCAAVEALLYPAILDRFDTRITRVLLDERTGVVIETSLDTYLPNPAMRRFLRKRDSTCRFPGCARNATRCEPDHVIAHSQGGPTTPSNLTSLCKHHHRVKHNAGWTLTMTREGVCTWTDPHGRQYTTHPTNHHQLAA